MSNDIKIKGMLPLQKIIDLPGRAYGIEVHKHFPAEDYATTNFPFIGLPDDIAELRRAIPKKWFNCEAYAATVEDGILIGNSGMVLTPDGWLIHESASLAGTQPDKRCIDVPTILKRIKTIPRNAITKISGRAFAAVNPNGGYAHHLAENCIPMLLFSGVDFNWIVTTPGANHGIVQSWLGLSAYPSDHIYQLPSDKLLQAEQMSFYGASSVFLFRKELEKLAYDTLVAPRIKNVASNLKVYQVYKHNDKKIADRLCISLDAVDDFYKQQGYEAVDPAMLSFREKLELYPQCAEIAGVCNSGLLNCLFCNANIQVSLIVPPQHFPVYYYPQKQFPFVFTHLESLYPIYSYFNNFCPTVSTLGIFYLANMEYKKFAFFRADYGDHQIDSNSFAVDMERLNAFHRITHRD